MKTKLIALNLLLLAGIAAVAWQARVRWDDARSKRRANLAVRLAPAVPPALAPVPKPEAPPASKYADIAQKDLFVKDRNPNIVIDAPPPPPKPMPALPVIYGVMGLPSGFRAFMAERAGSGSRPVKIGDRMGEFKILSLDAQNIVFEWDGKPIARKVDDLIDRSSRDGGSRGASASSGPAPVTLNGGTASPPQQPGQQQTQPPPSNNTQRPAGPGVEIGSPGQSQRACAQGDNSVAGTVVEGYKKTILNTPFGQSCRWVPAQ